MADEEKLPQGVMIIDPEGKIAGEVENIVGDLGGWELLEGDLDWEHSPAEAKKHMPAVIFVNLDAGLEEALENAARVSSVSPQSALLGVSEMENGQEGEWLLRGIRSGFQDFLRFPLDRDEVAAALTRIERELLGGQGATGRVVTLFSPRGGSGLTTLVVNLGVILARERKLTVGLLDLDLELGDVSFFLNLAPAMTIGDLVSTARPLSKTILQEAFVPHESGIDVLAAPLEIQQAERVSEEAVGQIIQVMREMFDFVLINTARNFSPITLRALDASDVILLLTLPHLAAIADTRRTLDVFRSLGYQDRIRLVINRLSPDDDVNVEEVEKALGPVFVAVPSDYRQVMRSLNRGLPLWEYAPRAQVTRSLLTLANKLAGTDGLKGGKKRKRKKWRKKK